MVPVVPICHRRRCRAGPAWRQYRQGHRLAPECPDRLRHALRRLRDPGSLAQPAEGPPGAM